MKILKWPTFRFDHDWSKVSILPLPAKSDPDPGSTLVWLLDPDPDPHWNKLLVPDPHWGELLNESGSSLRWIAGSCSWSGSVLGPIRIWSTVSNCSGVAQLECGMADGSMTSASACRIRQARVRHSPGSTSHAYMYYPEQWICPGAEFMDVHTVQILWGFWA